jgi:hypothetical protein
MYTPQPLYRNSPWYPVKKRLGGPQNRSRYFGEKKNLFLLPGIKPRMM